MPRYYFHTLDGKVAIDTDGTDLPGLTEAKREAAHMLGVMLCRQADEIIQDRMLTVEVTDRSSRALFRLDMSVQNEPADRRVLPG